MAKGVFEEKEVAQFNARLEELLRELGWDKSTLAQRANLANATISRWASFQRPPTSKTLQKIADVTGCRVAWLVTGKGSMWPEYVDGPEVSDGKGKEFSSTKMTPQQLYDLLERIEGYLAREGFPLSPILRKGIFNILCM